MQSIAYAKTTAQYNKNVEIQQKSNIYMTNRKVCDKVWLPRFKYQAHTFRKQLVINMVNN